MAVMTVYLLLVINGYLEKISEDTRISKASLILFTIYHLKFLATLPKGDNFMNIKDKIYTLCAYHGISRNALEKELGFGSGTIARWGSSSPSVDKLQKVADHFNVSIDELIGREMGIKKELPDLTPKDEREIANQLENMMNNLDDETAFAAVGGTVEDENDRELLRTSLEMALRVSKQIAKKKYRKVQR